LEFSTGQKNVIDHQNAYFSERSPESEGDKIIIRAPEHPERSLLRARVGCPPITPPGEVALFATPEGGSLRHFPGE